MNQSEAKNRMSELAGQKAKAEREMKKAMSGGATRESDAIADEIWGIDYKLRMLSRQFALAFAQAVHEVPGKR